MPHIDTNPTLHNGQCPVCGDGPCLSPTLCGSDQPPEKPKTNGHAKTRPAYSFRLPGQFSDVQKDWLFKNLMARGEVSSWIGAPGGTKSMLLTDIAVHGAAGKEWRGRRCKEPFGVVYFALERGRLTERRIRAYEVNGTIGEGTPLGVVSQMIDLCDQRCVMDIINTVRSVEMVTDTEVGLLIFDTYNKGIAAGGGDENFARDQNLTAANMRRILERLDVHIAGIGHTGKDVERGERGSNARKADVDLEVSIRGTDGIFRASVTKANDQEDGLITGYRPDKVVLGTDEDGDEVATWIISADEVTVPEMTKTRAIPAKAKAVLSAIQEAQENCGEFVTSNYVPPETKVAPIAMAREYFRKRNPDAGKNDFRDGLYQLQARELAGVWEWSVWASSDS